MITFDLEAPVVLALDWPTSATLAHLADEPEIHPLPVDLTHSDLELPPARSIGNGWAPRRGERGR